jgi:ParB-like chromosome segregation protein Spo0J
MDGERPSGLSIDYISISALKPYPTNARTHTKHQIRQIAESIRVFGFTNPALIDGKNRIIAGHGRIGAAKLLGMTEVSTIRLDRMTDDQIRAYVLAAIRKRRLSAICRRGLGCFS